MGQRPAHATFLAIVSAFVARKSWTQAELAREIDVGVEAVRKHLRAMKEDGWPLQEERSGAQVYWRMPPGWVPGVLTFNAGEVPDLLRVLARSPRSAARDRLMASVAERLPLKHQASFEKAVRPASVSRDEDEWLAVLEDSAAKGIAVRMRYTTASRQDDTTRHVSVHRVDVGPPTRFAATCHRSGRIKWFRLSGVSHARLDRAEVYRPADAGALAAVVGATVGGFHAEGPPVACVFFVRQPESAWVKRNLLEGMKSETVPGGLRVSIDTAAVDVVARFVVQHGEAATPETPELADRVTAIARGALTRVAG